LVGKENGRRGDGCDVAPLQNAKSLLIDEDEDIEDIGQDVLAGNSFPPSTMSRCTSHHCQEDTGFGGKRGEIIGGNQNVLIAN
jgi:hypothetical protein